MGFLVAVFLAAGFLLGCGDGREDGSGSDAPTKAEYIAQSDKICRRTVKGTKLALRAFLFSNGLVSPAEMSADQTEELVSTISVPSLRETVEKLGRLELPEAAEEEAEEVIAAFEEYVAGLEADPNASERLEYVNKTAHEFGFEVCWQ